MRLSHNFLLQSFELPFIQTNARNHVESSQIAQATTKHIAEIPLFDIVCLSGCSWDRKRKADDTQFPV